MSQRNLLFGLVFCEVECPKRESGFLGKAQQGHLVLQVFEYFVAPNASGSCNIELGGGGGEGEDRRLGGRLVYPLKPFGPRYGHAAMTSVRFGEANG